MELVQKAYGRGLHERRMIKFMVLNMGGLPVMPFEGLLGGLIW
jgi:hypothetical protein